MQIIPIHETILKSFGANALFEGIQFNSHPHIGVGWHAMRYSEGRAETTAISSASSGITTYAKT